MNTSPLLFEHRKLFDQQEENILFSWGEHPRVSALFETKDISKKFFYNHFGKKVIAYILNMINRQADKNYCEVTIVIVDYMKTNGFSPLDFSVLFSCLKDVMTDVLVESGDINTSLSYDLSVLVHDSCEIILGVKEKVALIPMSGANHSRMNLLPAV